MDPLNVLLSAGDVRKQMKRARFDRGCVAALVARHERIPRETGGRQLYYIVWSTPA